MVRVRSFVFAALMLAGCKDMVDQPRYDSYDRRKLFADDKVLQAPPEGVVARDRPRHEADAIRPAMSMALLERGRERYGIDCAMCHAYDGSGRGIVPARGFPAPPSFADGRLRDPAFVYDVITRGYGIMYAHADRVSRRDRWAIAAYLQALQLSQHAQASGLPPAVRRELVADAH